MSLPAHLLRQLLVALKTDATRRRATDKRSAPRVGFRHPVDVAPTAAPPGHTIPAWVRNLSANGIGLLARRPLSPGAEFVVPFDRPDTTPLQILYRTTHIARLAPDLFAIGGRLVCVVEPLPTARANGRAAS